MKPRENQLYQKGLRWLLGSAVLAVVSVGGWVLYSQTLNRSSEAVEVRLITIEQDTLKETIDESGIVELGDQQTLKAPKDGTVAEVLVEVGDRVLAGDPLVILYNPEQETKLTQHQLDIEEKELQRKAKAQAVSAAQKDLADAQEDLQRISGKFQSDRSEILAQELQIQQKELELETLRARVVNAQEDLADAEEDLQEDEDLLEEGFISEDEFRRRQKEVRTARSQLRQAQSDIRRAQLEMQGLRAKIPELERQIEERNEERQKEIQQAQKAVRETENSLSQAQSEVDRAANELQKLQLETQKIEQELQENIVTAPAAGQVLDVQVSRGDVVKLEAELLTLGNPAQEIVKLQLNTLNVSRVQLNQPALVTIIGRNSDTFSAKVVELSLRATSGGGQGGSGRESAQATVPAIVRLDAPSGVLIPGTSVGVEIILNQKDDVLVLSNEAVQQPDADPFVWTMDESGLVQQQPITLGLQEVTQVEVTSGLKVGDEVVIPPIDKPLEPGNRVVPISSD